MAGAAAVAVAAAAAAAEAAAAAAAAGAGAGAGAGAAVAPACKSTPSNGSTSSRQKYSLQVGQRACHVWSTGSGISILVLLRASHQRSRQ